MLRPPVPTGATAAGMTNPYAAPYTSMAVPIDGDFSSFGKGNEGYAEEYRRRRR